MEQTGEGVLAGRNLCPGEDARGEVKLPSPRCSCLCFHHVEAAKGDGEADPGGAKTHLHGRYWKVRVPQPRVLPSPFGVVQFEEVVHSHSIK